MEDELIKYLEFDARAGERGGATGYMLFTDEAKATFIDVDGTGDGPRDEEVPFPMKADLDSMTVEKNRAILTGFVRDSSYASYVGKWVQLVIEDNDGIEVLQVRMVHLHAGARRMDSSDAEIQDDKGAFLSWWSTDAERRDDVGIPSPNLIPGISKVVRLIHFKVTSGLRF